MTNIDRAVLTIVKQYNGAWHPPEGSPVLVAQALADAGLLAPELPDESWPQVWEVNGFLVTAIEDGGETIGLAEHEGDGNEGLGWFMDKHLARKLAHALLAAVKYAEEHDAS